MNGDDRWPDVLSRRLHGATATASRWSTPASAATRSRARPNTAATSRSRAAPRRQRLERDVLRALRRVRRDLARGHQRFQQERQRHGRGGHGGDEGGRRPHLRAKCPAVRVIGATLTSALGSTSARARLPGAGRQAQGAQRVHPHVGHVRRRRRFRQGDARSATGGLRPEFVPDSTTGGAGRQAASQPRRLCGDGQGDRP